MNPTVAQVREVFEPLEEVTDLLALHLNSRDAEAAVVDAGHVELFVLSVDKAALGIEASNETWGLNLEKILRFTKIIPQTANIMMERDGTRLVLRVGSLEHRIPLLDLDGINTPKVPSLTFEYSAEIDAKELRRAVRACAQVDLDIMFRADGTGLYAEAVGEDGDHVQVLLSDAPTEKEIRSAYALQLLWHAIGHVKSGKIKFEFGSNFPLRITYPLLGGLGEMQYYLAPRLGGD